MVSLNVLSHRLAQYDGYGRFATSLMREMLNRKIDIRPGFLNHLEMPGDLLQLTNIDPNALCLSITPGQHITRTALRQWAFTMTEDDSAPKTWPERINRTCEVLLVPCEDNAIGFKRAGVTVPIYIVPGGTDPLEFEYVDRPDNDLFIFGCLGDRVYRKKFQLVVEAFKRAFPQKRNDVRLIVKALGGTLPGIDNESFGDNRISILKETLPSMAQFYNRIHSFVFPTVGEGYGMPPREAAMTGLPVIATSWVGLRDNLEHWGIPLNEFKLTRSGLESVDGYWAEVDANELAERMLWVYNHQKEAKAIGRNAAAWLRTHGTWVQSVDRLLEVLRVHNYV